jgi:hypothetical protein
MELLAFIIPALVVLGVVVYRKRKAAEAKAISDAYMRDMKEREPGYKDPR